MGKGERETMNPDPFPVPIFPSFFFFSWIPRHRRKLVENSKNRHGWHLYAQLSDPFRNVHRVESFGTSEGWCGCADFYSDAQFPLGSISRFGELA